MYMNTSIEELFTKLSVSIDVFVHEAENKKATAITTDEWCVKDELCHIVFGMKIML